MSSSSTDPTAAGPLLDVTMPQMGVSVAEGTVVAWRVEVGERVTAEQVICEISTDKIDTEVPAPAAGVVAAIVVAVEETVEVGAVLARLAVGEGAAAAPAPAVAPPAANGSRRHYSPVVRRIAAEHGIDLAEVTGTGRGGRVRKQDVLALVGPPAADPPLHIESPYRPDPPAAPPPLTPPASAVEPGLSRMRRQIGEHMKRSLDTAATCTTWAEADMTRVQRARADLGLTALAFVAAATVRALRAHPALNATLEGERYARHADVNLGIAVSLGDEGLIVPVIHRAQELSAEGLGARIRDLARRARAGALSADEVRSGTFTITNPGQFGSIMATPVINQPQVAILDLEAIVKRPVVLSAADGADTIAIREMTILGLSWDHRALDGAEAARFLATLRERLESVESR